MYKAKDRLADITAELETWSTKRFCTKRHLLSLIGKLEFLCKVVRHGRTFLRRLIELSKKVKFLHNKIRINYIAHRDINWWLNFMHHYHGVSVMYDEQWISNEKLNLWTDSSDYAIGCLYKHLFNCKMFDEETKMHPIVWKEMYAILVACETWGHYFKAKRILFNCDNNAVVCSINSGVSKNTELMALIRKLFFICALYNFEISAVYLPSKSNVLADSLSRFDFKRFYNNCKEPYKMIQCAPIDVLHDLNNYR